MNVQVIAGPDGTILWTSGAATRLHPRPEGGPDPGDLPRTEEGGDPHPRRQGAPRRPSSSRPTRAATSQSPKKRRTAHTPNFADPANAQTPSSRPGHSPQAPLQPQQSRSPHQGHHRPTELRDHPEMRKGHSWLACPEVTGHVVNASHATDLHVDSKAYARIYASHGISTFATHLGLRSAENPSRKADTRLPVVDVEVSYAHSSLIT